MTFKNKLIIYDNDETLARTDEIINGALIDTVHNYASEEYRQFTAKFVTRDCAGTTVQGIFDEMAKRVRSPLDQKIVDQIIREYQVTYAQILPSRLPQDPEQIQIITDLSTDFLQCVASNGRRRNVEATVAAVGVGHIVI